MAKTICWIPHTKKNRSKKYGNKDGKTLYKLMHSSAYGKTMKHLRNRIDAKLVNNKKRLFKTDIQTKLYVTQNI